MRRKCDDISVIPCKTEVSVNSITVTVIYQRSESRVVDSDIYIYIYKKKKNTQDLKWDGLLVLAVCVN